MKGIVLYLLIASAVYSADINIDELMEVFNERSSFMIRYRLEWEKFLKEEKGLERNRRQKVDYRGEMFRESSTDREIRRRYEEVEKGQFSLYYDVFYYEGVYEFEDSGYYAERGEGLKENRLGMRKALNDLLYSEKKYEVNYIQIKGEIVRNMLLYDYLTEAERLIDTYGEIVSLQQSIEVDRRSVEEYGELYEIAKKKAETGEGLSLETGYIRAEGMEIGERLSYNTAIKGIKMSKLGREAGIDLDENMVAALFSVGDQISIITNDYDLKRTQSEISLEREDIKLKKRREQPEFVLGGDYDSERELWSMRFTLDGSIFDYPLDSKLGESQADIMAEGAKQRERLRESDQAALRKEHRYLKNLLEIKRLKKENREKTVEVADEMYRMGYITAKKLIDEKRESRDARMEFLEVFNRLGAFEYKMKLREKVAQGTVEALKF